MLSKVNIQNKRQKQWKVGEPVCICPNKCGVMQRRVRILPPKDDSIGKGFFTEWDFCLLCKHVQHYQEFRVKMI